MEAVRALKGPRIAKFDRALTLTSEVTRASFINRFRLDGSVMHQRVSREGWQGGNIDIEEDVTEGGTERRGVRK
jgi:hypothetical protein